MNLPGQLAQHLRDVHFGGNWTSVNIKETLKDVTWQQATTQVYSCNTIATLVYHMNYYISAVLKVLQGESLIAKDADSFTHPPIQTREDWEQLINKTWADAETFAGLIEQLPEKKLWEDFTDKKYGSYYRNIQGVIEHLHYHLGQIVIIKKVLVQVDNTEN